MLSKWEPSKESGLKGYVEFRVPKFKERMDLIKQIGIKVDSNGEMDTSVDKLDVVIKMEEVCKKYVKNVSLSTGKHKFENLEDLEVTEAYGTIVSEVANEIMSGVRLGKL